VPASLAASQFREDFFEARRPVVLRSGTIQAGGAFDWSASAVAAEHGDEPVEVRVFDAIQAGKHLRFAGLMKRTERMTLAEFLGPIDRGGPSALGREGVREVRYLRLDTTANAVPGLLDRVRFPALFDRIGTGHDDWLVHDTFLRIGPANYEYPAHCDNLENILLHLHGRKEVVLFEPRSIAAMYPDPADLARSQVDDIDAPDVARFPAFARLSRHRCVLEPGDALYIPMLWFHNVRSIGYGVSTNRSFRRANHLAHVLASKPHEWREFEAQLGRRVY
jgi:tRNA wybutosine-synthesizing protein 5